MDNFLNPAKVLEKLKLNSTMTAADFGSGSGGWALPLAKILQDGYVYAIDILEEPLSALRLKAKTLELKNIETVKADVEKGSRLGSESCDLVLMTNLFFQAENEMLILEEGKRVIRPGGKILVVDWKKDVPLGPSQNRALPEEIKNSAEKAGLKLESEFDASSYHYGLIFGK